ncbi:Thioredoxin domain protein [Synechococcus sp. PCC 7335]|uniref:thioredoxin domain-containing protein n=1 Tax=Synechococcus sp. (strain ATCC 29403 / PCC 7335) TaxID=91464 RepID=UPI00017ED25B|nr:thioredoxin domain-containing protein [Synechococcus sp. PCC 7335]EDX84591.1 Thioredoxin domain protein [Synechococcus sp. PCC 7335]
MTSISNKNVNKNLGEPNKRLWIVLIVLPLAMVMAIMLTRPAANIISMTPLSGLITLKSMAADAVPYDIALASQKPTLIEFYADWCTTCQSMSGTVEALHDQYGDRLNFVMLDIDDPQWASQIEVFGATGVPQFTLLDSRQHQVETWVGKVPKPVFSNVFDRLLS